MLIKETRKTRGGLISPGCIFCLQVRGLISGSLRYFSCKGMFEQAY